MSPPILCRVFKSREQMQTVLRLLDASLSPLKRFSMGNKSPCHTFSHHCGNLYRASRFLFYRFHNHFKAELKRVFFLRRSYNSGFREKC
ncbi:hypothetical protein GDO81_022474 [Engystomops pustulosus]|uniref:Uncharacterized protein n=1 Tax=Engystomops pustulosus TaxID=76066 RepID=A0AAV6ZNY0_ENGPU|nr:hypothetical protein GDO81_022474 [Engystomops pustulosus]